MKFLILSLMILSSASAFATANIVTTNAGWTNAREVIVTHLDTGAVEKGVLQFKGAPEGGYNPNYGGKSPFNFVRLSQPRVVVNRGVGLDREYRFIRHAAIGFRPSIKGHTLLNPICKEIYGLNLGLMTDYGYSKNEQIVSLEIKGGAYHVKVEDFKNQPVQVLTIVTCANSPYKGSE